MYNIFEVPIYDVDLSLNTQSISTYCKSLKKKNKGTIKSNNGGWHSNHLQGSHLPLNDLFLEIEKHSNLFLKKIQIENNIKIKDIWVNINNYKDSNNIHFHPNNIISGVYYVEVPKNSGDIYFNHPAQDLMDCMWGETNIKNFNTTNCFNYTLKSKANKLFLFPSWLKHGVRPNLSKKDRISISFNLE